MVSDNYDYILGVLTSAEPEVFEHSLQELFTMIKDELDSQGEYIKALQQLTDEQSVTISKLEEKTTMLCERTEWSRIGD